MLSFILIADDSSKVSRKKKPNRNDKVMVNKGSILTACELERVGLVLSSTCP